MIFSTSKLVKEGQKWKRLRESLSRFKQKTVVAGSRMLAVETEGSRQIFSELEMKQGLLLERIWG